MKSIELSFAACDDVMLCIGKKGENLAARVCIDCSDAHAGCEMTGCVIRVKNANGDTYPVQPDLQGEVLIWNITDSDTAYAGIGQAQIELLGTNGAIIKTAIMQVGVLESLTVGADTPDPVLDWLDDVNETLQVVNAAADSASTAAEEAEEAADWAVEAAESIEGLTVSETVVDYGEGVSAAVSRDPENGALHLALQVERGPGYTIKGSAYPTVEALEAAVSFPAVGDQYNVGDTAPYSVYRWTGTEWENQGTVQGPPGLDAPQIDDTQASADHPWSGQKVQQELDALTAEDVGALSASGSGALVQTGRVEVIVPTEGWTQNAQGWYERMVTCAGTVAGSQTQRVDAAVQGAQIGNVLLAGLRVDANDTLTMVCLAQPSQAFTLVALISEVV